MSENNQTPLEQAQEQAKNQAENLQNARENERMQTQNHEVEEVRVDTQIEAPGAIGKSGAAPNPRNYPQRDLGQK